jgi:hypothetical protein
MTPQRRDDDTPYEVPSEVLARRQYLREKDLLHKLDDRTARLLACDFAEHVLPIFEKHRPDDMRPRNAVAMARRFANGEATAKELSDAQVDAWNAAEVYPTRAAYIAATAASWTACEDARGATHAQWDATWAAEENDSSGAAERQWQEQRVREELGL